MSGGVDQLPQLSFQIPFCLSSVRGVSLGDGSRASSRCHLRGRKERSLPTSSAGRGEVGFLSQLLISMVGSVQERLTDRSPDTELGIASPGGPWR